MIRKIGKLAAAATLAMSLGVAGGSSVVGGVTHVHAAQGGNSGVSQFCKQGGALTIAEFFFGTDVPVSQGACVSFIQSALINTNGGFGSAIAASICQSVAPGEQGACVSSFNAYFKGGNG